MAATGALYPMVFDSAFQKKIDLDTDTIKAVLMASYTYAATHQYMSDVLAAGTQATGTGYTAGGQTLTGVSWSRSGNVYTFDCADPVWSATGGSLSAAYLVIVDTTPGTDATNPVIGYVNLDGAGGTVTATDASFTVTVNASGLLRFTAS